MGWVYLIFTIVIGAGVPLLSWIFSQRLGAELVVERAGLQSRLVDGIQGLADITVFDRGNDYLEQLKGDGEACGHTQRQLAAISGFSSAFNTGLVNLGMLSTLAIAIPLVVAGKLPGVMLAVLTLSALAGFEAVMPLAQAAQTLSSSLQSGRRLFELVDAEPAVRDRVPSRRVQIRNMTLQFSDLDFGYPDGTDLVLRGINFNLPPGKRLAIVGPSGAGKTLICTNTHRNKPGSYSVSSHRGHISSMTRSVRTCFSPGLRLPTLSCIRLHEWRRSKILFLDCRRDMKLQLVSKGFASVAGKGRDWGSPGLY
jgi:ATP-binding cassette subfamily C protein CydC